MARTKRPAKATTVSLAYQYGGNHKTGWLAYLPDQWLPYVQLARLSPPVGLFLIYFPHAFGILHAAIRYHSALGEVARAGGLLFAASFFVSNAIHIWNDLIDAPIDAKVQRTSRRPIPRGAVSPTAAFLFTASQAAVAFLFVLCLRGDPVKNSLYSVPGILGWAYYPYAKLHTFWPQAVLGFCLSWGIVMGSLSLGLQPTVSEGGRVDITTILLFIASTCWTMIYDSVYAFQDIHDDVTLGVGSMAVLFKYRIKPVLYILVMVIGICLGVLGRGEQMGLLYYLVGVAGTTLFLTLMIFKVDLRDSASCWWWFSKGFWYAGGSIIGGLLSEYVRVA